MNIEDYLWKEDDETQPRMSRQNGEDILHLPGIEDELIRMRVITAHNAEIRRLWERIRPKTPNEGLKHG